MKETASSAGIRGPRFGEVLGLLLVLFVAWRLPALHLPFFWDEMGVYGPQALWLFDHGLSLSPAAVPPELSRGHPLLLANLHAIGFEIFGARPLVGHAVALAFSLALLASTAWIGRRRYGAFAGIFAATCLAVQPVFAAQSTLLLPEVPLALALLWGVHAWANRDHVRAAVAFGVAALLKETSALVPGILVVLDLGAFLWARQWWRWRELGRPLLVLALPASVLLLFLLWQHSIHGWFLFPYHVESVSLDPSRVWLHLQQHVHFLLRGQGRTALGLLLLAGVVYGLWRRKDRFVIGVVVVVLASWAFFAVNFFMYRYLLYTLPLAVLVAFSPPIPVRLRPLALLVLVMPLRHLEVPYWNHDDDLSFARQARVQREASRYLQEQGRGREVVLHARFPFDYGIRDARLGLLDPSTPFRYRLADPGEAEYVVVSDPGYSAPAEQLEGYVLEESFVDGFASVRIYRRP